MSARRARNSRRLQRRLRKPCPTKRRRRRLQVAGFDFSGCQLKDASMLAWSYLRSPRPRTPCFGVALEAPFHIVRSVGVSWPASEALLVNSTPPRRPTIGVGRHMLRVVAESPTAVGFGVAGALPAGATRSPAPGVVALRRACPLRLDLGSSSSACSIRSGSASNFPEGRKPLI